MMIKLNDVLNWAVLQITVEEVLLLWGWGIRGSWLSPPTLPLHLGEEYRQPGEDLARNEGRDATGPCGRSLALWQCYIII